MVLKEVFDAVWEATLRDDYATWLPKMLQQLNYSDNRGRAVAAVATYARWLATDSLPSKDPRHRAETFYCAGCVGSSDPVSSWFSNAEDSYNCPRCPVFGYCRTFRLIDAWKDLGREARRARLSIRAMPLPPPEQE